ncbi:MAG: zinc-ribbon domain-containing protein [Halobacteriaceae archaeon]
MEPATWLYGLVAVFTAAYLLALLYGYGRHTAPPEPGAAGAPSGADAETAEGEVLCPHCGAMNDADYQFCRRCVADLRHPANGGGRRLA